MIFAEPKAAKNLYYERLIILLFSSRASRHQKAQLQPTTYNVYFNRFISFFLINYFLLYSTLTVSAQNVEDAIKLNSQGIVLYKQAKYRESLSMIERALAIFEKTLGPQHPYTASCLLDLANIHFYNGDFAKTLPLLERSLAIREKALGPEHPDTAASLNNLAITYHSIGDYYKAQPLIERALAIRERMLGPEHPDTAASIQNLASIYRSIGDNVMALPLLERALTIYEKVYGPMHQDNAIIMGNLANIHSLMGNYDKAMLLLERSLAIREKALGPEHPDTAASLNDMCYILYHKRDYVRALPLLERALTIYDKVYGPEHPYTAMALDNLASLYEDTGDYVRARHLNDRAVVINEKVLGPNHPDLAASLHNQAINYQAMRDYDKARALLERALAINDKALGPNHPDTAEMLNTLAINAYLTGDILSARSYAIRKMAAKQKELESILLLDEHTRLSWQSRNLAYWIALLIPYNNLSQFILSQKGIILDSLAEDRALALAAGSYGEGNTILQKIKALASSLSKITFEQGKEAEATSLKDEIARLQRELTAKYLGRERQRSSASITMADIMPTLAGGAVLVDFIQFNDPKLKRDEATCLGAVITGEDNKSVFVRIDGGTAINRSIDSLRTAINQGNASEVEAQTKFLSEKLWSPIAAQIPEGTKRLFLCPDANLNFLSFAALLEGDGRFVAEKYPITYIGSARDLAKQPSGKITKSMAILANPQFDSATKNTKTSEMVAMRSAEADVFGSIELPPLPGTEIEAASLQALATESGWQTKTYLGKNATESTVHNTKKPGVLHLATHGFYLNSFTPPGPEGSRGMSVVGVKETAEEKKKKEKSVDPMRASGVALTGAQQTLNSWSHKKAPNPETDGVLTAEEVGALRLDGTWLVVLSACETGVGEARSGEGVFGLRRAFMIAGAENLLMTLWPVADETTAKLMADFYKQAFATGDAPGSLAKVQRDWFVKLRQERGLLAAIREAGPFAMVVMTNPNAQHEFVEGQIELAPEKAAAPKSAKILEFQAALAKADAGDAYAQAVVSIYFGLGIGCEQNPSKSKDYVMLSAKQQNPLGIYRLAEMREVGEGMEQNSDQAQQLMQKAKPGLQKLSTDPYALTALATIYERENPASPKIREVLTKASEMGYEPAQKKLTQLQSNN